MDKELIDQMAKLICNPDKAQIDKPFWSSGRVGITDGFIAVIFRFEEKLEEWGNFPKPDDFFKLCDRESTLIDIELPDIEPQEHWENPFEQVKDECEECNGTGYVECNYGHEHECEECCNGTILTTALKRNWPPAEERYIELPELGLFDKRYLWIISQLAKHRQLRYSFELISGTATLHFSFEDGNGLLMGVQKRN